MLKPDRFYLDTDISWFMDEVAERGGCVSVSATGSGNGLDQGVRKVTYAANPSGKVPMGILTCDMVNKDLSKTHLNYYKEEVQKGGKVTLVRKGRVLTNLIQGTVTNGSETAYLGMSGYITTQNAAGAPVIGRFESKVDEDGYALVNINL